MRARGAARDQVPGDAERPEGALFGRVAERRRTRGGGDRALERGGGVLRSEAPAGCEMIEANGGAGGARRLQEQEELHVEPQPRRQRVAARTVVSGVKDGAEQELVVDGAPVGVELVHADGVARARGEQRAARGVVRAHCQLGVPRRLAGAARVEDTKAQRAGVVAARVDGQRQLEPPAAARAVDRRERRVSGDRLRRHHRRLPAHLDERRRRALVGVEEDAEHHGLGGGRRRRDDRAHRLREERPQLIVHARDAALDAGHRLAHVALRGRVHLALRNCACSAVSPTAGVNAQL